MADASVTFAVGSEQATVVLPVDLPSTGNVYEINALTAPWSNQPSGSTADQTASIKAQIAAIPDGVPGAPNIIRFPVGKSSGKYFVQGDLAANPRGTGGGVLLRNRKHLIIEGPSPTDPATFYNVSPAVPYTAQIQQNQQSERRTIWLQGCIDVTVRNLRVEGSNYTNSFSLANGTPAFWLGGQDSGGTWSTRGYHAPWEAEHAFAFEGGADCRIVDCEAQDIWGDGLYLGQYFGKGVEGFYGGSSVPDQGATFQGTTPGNRLFFAGMGRQGVALSYASDVVLDGMLIGQNPNGRTRRAGIDLEPVPGWVVERVEIKNFEIHMGNMVTIAALGSNRVDHINIHHGLIHLGLGNRVMVGASDATRRTDWRIADIVWDTAFGSPAAGMSFVRVDGVLVERVECPIINTQSRRAVSFGSCGGSLVLKDSKWGDALWVDYLNSPIPDLVNNTPALTLRNQ